MKLYELVVVAGVAGASCFAAAMYLAPKMEETAASTPATASIPHESQVQEIQPRLSANSAQLRRENDGHYWANANVDGTFVRFMIDTGASTVALTERDARRMGLDPETLVYDWKVRTAGGEVQGASILLGSIQIGRIEVENVEAMVLRDGLEQSLLGMSFLSQMESYEFRRSSLILRQ